jgi:hypothetical protein
LCPLSPPGTPEAGDHAGQNSRDGSERTGDPDTIDFHERATQNHILGSQHCERGGFVYYLSIRRIWDGTTLTVRLEWGLRTE